MVSAKELREAVLTHSVATQLKGPSSLQKGSCNSSVLATPKQPDAATEAQGVNPQKQALGSVVRPGNTNPEGP